MAEWSMPGMEVRPDLCTGCEICARDCPVSVITMAPTAPGAKYREVAVIQDNCVRCDVCVKACPFDAIVRPTQRRAGTAVCESCPVLCEIPEGALGACKRYTNTGGRTVRLRDLVVPAPGAGGVGQAVPLVTGIGAGTTYPCFKPAPYIVRGQCDGIDVVSVVTEAPLSYCNLEAHIPCAEPIGRVGEKITHKSRRVGLVAAHVDGATVLDLGGIDHIESAHSAVVTQMVVDLCNGDPVRLRLGGRMNLDLQLDRTPLRDGRPVRAASAEPGQLSLFLVGGVGGSARAGVTRYPIRLTEAVHDGRITVTIGGAPVFLYPGANIIVGVDVSQVTAGGAFARLPVPAVIIPLEYTMPLSLYEDIGGHMAAVRELADVAGPGAGGGSKE